MKPPSATAAAMATVALQPIGVLRTAQQLHHEAPRQSGLGRGSEGHIQLRQGLQNCLRDLGGFSHIWLLSYCHLANGYADQLVPPRDTQKRGVLATRAPRRPNPLGLSCVRLLAIQKRVLVVADHDLLDGTPILDIKPYLPYCDSVPDAAIGYVANLAAAADDHRCWWEEKGVEPPHRYRARGINSDSPR